MAYGHYLSSEECQNTVWLREGQMIWAHNMYCTLLTLRAGIGVELRMKESRMARSSSRL
ncbi:hypothetical protein BDR05DRAFT_963320, partial [Suillus weaverae]